MNTRSHLITITLLAAGALVIDAGLHGCSNSTASTQATTKKSNVVTFTPSESVEVLWIDTAGNIGLRGVAAVVPGTPKDDKQDLPAGCRESAVKNGDGTVTICMNQTVGKSIAKSLGFSTP